MKVKNIMFSGFMAAVLAGACGAADAATVLASKEFVTSELSKKQNTLEQGDNIVIDGNKISAVQYDPTELNTKVTNLQTAVGDNNSGLVKEVAGIKDVIDTLGNAEGVATLTTDVSDLKEAMAGLPEGKTVAEAIAGAVSDKVTTSGLSTTLEGYTTDAEHTALADRVTANEGAITGLQNTKADKTDLNGYVTTGTLTTYQGTVSAALDGKASTGDVTALDGRVTANETAISNLDSTYAKDSEVTTAIENLSKDGGAIATLTGTVAGIEADVEGIETELATVKATANAAQTAEQVDAAIEAKGYTSAIADAKKAGTDAADALDAYKGEMTNTLAGKVDNAELDKYYTKTQADAAFLEDAGLVNGAAYLVTKDSQGNVVYSEVSVIGNNEQIVIGRAQ